MASADLQQRMDAFMEMCRQSGVKATHQRREIFREVARTEEHPDAETVFRRVRRRIPTVSLDTVYRTLALLEERRLVSRLEAFAGRARFDANTDAHHHLVCIRCGEVRDFQDEQMDHLGAPEHVRPWGEVRSVHVQLRGVCSACSSRG
jgi:Fur family peroxide stress response transcriptional regulator